jgi:hypothetical protein
MPQLGIDDNNGGSLSAYVDANNPMSVLMVIGRNPLIGINLSAAAINRHISDSVKINGGKRR